MTEQLSPGSTDRSSHEENEAAEQEQAAEQDEAAEQEQALAREVFVALATRWAPLVLEALNGRTLRFTELLGEVAGVSHKMLTQTLRALERDGIVRRVVHPTVPPRVDYSLTPTGAELLATVHGLCGWSRVHGPAVRQARARFDAAAAAATTSATGSGPGRR
ncbi:winged helix-turn-helix transcriptional regulator [Kitasatospora sp. NPDC008050]|uniref:winged helix-turn-helix transcriptional regulator n=1 Tax=Kitasatospora sp. NPDC008050 TaxID=3364021 RepID=UPI0036F12364